MKTIKEVKARCKVGTQLLCVENTYAPAFAGKVRTITKPGPSVNQCEQDERPFRMEWRPGIEILDPDTFRMPIGRTDHTVTLRFVHDPEVK